MNIQDTQTERKKNIYDWLPDYKNYRATTSLMGYRFVCMCDRAKNFALLCLKLNQDLFDVNEEKVQQIE